MKKNQKGFSLIELVIAMAILVILTGLASMQVMRHIAKSRNTACMHDMGVIADAYTIHMAQKSQWDKDEAQAALEETMKQFGAQQESANIEGMYAVYSGICKDAGKYQIRFSSDYSGISVSCSKHGEWKLDVIQLQEVLSNLSFKASDYNGSFKFTDLSGYFEGDSNKRLNSEAVSTGKDYGTAGSLAGVVANELSKQGINVKNKSWVMYKKDGKYILYLTDAKLTAQDAGTTVTCTVYNGSEVIQKEVNVKTQGTGANKYVCLDV